MMNDTPTVDIDQLVVRFSKRDAVDGLSLQVNAGRCHALFGRNGAGKTTTLKALLGLVQPDSGSIRLFGLDGVRHESEVKARLAFVPDQPGFYEWMTVAETLNHAAGLRRGWKADVAEHLLQRFSLDPHAPTSVLSKGQRTQLALVCAIGADPDLLVLDEPTSGLDPHVRRQFIEAVIGAFQDRNPERKTLLISTHLIGEFEGIIDEFTIMQAGRSVMSLGADQARSKFRRVRAWFEDRAPDTLAMPLPLLSVPKRHGRMLELLVAHDATQVNAALTGLGATSVETTTLSLEELYLAAA